MLTDVVLYGKGDLINSKTLEEDHLLEGVKLLIPLSRQGLVLWLLRVEDSSEEAFIGDEVLIEAIEGIELRGTVQVLVGLDPVKVNELLF